MNAKKAFGITTFIGAAVTCSIVASSYPIAIWAVGFAVSQKLGKKSQPQFMCPLLASEHQVAVTQEGRESDVRTLRKGAR